MKSRSIWAIALIAILNIPNIPNANSAETSIEIILESLAVKGRAPKTGYTRAQFGQTWADVNRNGCDTRNDIL